MRLNPDLLPIKGPREALESKLAPGASRTNRFVDFNFDIGTRSGSKNIPGSLSPSFSFILRPLSTLPALCPCFSFFLVLSAFLRFRRRSNDRDCARRNRRLYGRTPVIGWSRFIDGGISLLRTCLSATRARRAGRGESTDRDPDFRRISEDAASAFLNFRLSSLGNVRSFASITVARCKLFVFSAQ